MMIYWNIKNSLTSDQIEWIQQSIVQPLLDLFTLHLNSSEKHRKGMFYLPLMGTILQEITEYYHQYDEIHSEPMYRPCKAFHLFPQTKFIPNYIVLPPSLLHQVASQSQLTQNSFRENHSKGELDFKDILFQKSSQLFPHWINDKGKSFQLLQTDGVGSSWTYEKLENLERVDPIKRQKHDSRETTESTVSSSISMEVKKDRKINYLEDPEIRQKVLSLIQLNQIKCIVTLDPNRSNLFHASVWKFTDPCKETFLQYSSLPPETFRSNLKKSHEKSFCISGKEWKSIRRSKGMEQELHKRLAKHPEIHKIQTEIPTNKTTVQEQLKMHVQYMAQHMNTLLEFYSHRRYRRMKMESYSNEQNAYCRLMEICYQKAMNISYKEWKSYTKKERKQKINEWKSSTLFILGDGHFDPSSKGYEPSPSSKRLFDEFQKRNYLIYWIDEFRTSKLCSECHSEVQECKHPIRLKRAKTPENQSTRKNNLGEHVTILNDDDQKTYFTKQTEAKQGTQFRTFKPWGVRICSNKACRITWNRDRNSSHNMMVLTWILLMEGKNQLPDVFKRSNPTLNSLREVVL